jgi:hypothetical protein
MAAPKGNRFWEARASHGRELIFKDATLLHDMVLEYFEWNEENPLWEAKAFAFRGDVTIEYLPKMRVATLGSLCLFLGIAQVTWRQYAQRDGMVDGVYILTQDFASVCAWAEEAIRTQKFAGAAADLLNPAIIARDLGLADKREVTGANGQALQIISSDMTPAQAAEAYASTLYNDA